MTRPTLAISALTIAGLLMFHVSDAAARAGSGGSRGSRSFSAPMRSAPASTPTSPSRATNQPAPASPASPMPAQRPGMFGGLMGGLAGFALGGLLGGLLFGGFGGGLGGGFGLFDLLLIAGAGFLIFSMLRRRRDAQAPAYAMAGAPGAYDDAPRGGSTAASTTAVIDAPATDTDFARGVAHIRTMDPAFDPASVADLARRMFGGVQQAVEARDLTVVRDHVTAEMLAVLQVQVDRLRQERRTNRLERIDVRAAEPTEAWQESGQDFVTINLTGSLVDYTVDDATGAVVEGSKTDAQSVDEYWTFSRSVGPNRWKLSAIQTA